MLTCLAAMPIDHTYAHEHNYVCTEAKGYTRGSANTVHSSVYFHH